MFLLHIRACRLESICMIVHPEAATGGVLYEKVFFKISQNSQENTGVFWHRYFPVNFTKFIRTPLLQNSFGRLLLFILLTYCSSSLIAFKQVTKQVHNLLKTIYKSPRRKNVIWRNWAEPTDFWICWGPVVYFTLYWQYDRTALHRQVNLKRHSSRGNETLL